MNAHALRQRALDIRGAMGLALTVPRHRETLCESSPRNPLHFDVMEGGRAYQTVLVPTDSGTATVSDTFWRPDVV